MDHKASTSATYRYKTCGIALLVYIDPKRLQHQLTEFLEYSMDPFHPLRRVKGLRRRRESNGKSLNPPFCKDGGVRVWAGLGCTKAYGIQQQRHRHWQH